MYAFFIFSLPPPPHPPLPSHKESFFNCTQKRGRGYSWVNYVVQNGQNLVGVSVCRECLHVTIYP